MEITKGVVLKSLLWKYLEKSGVQGIRFLVSIILARLIAPSEFGVIAIVLILIELSNVVVDGGFNSSLIQKKETSNADYSTILYVSVVVSLVLYAILYLTAPYIASFYSDARLEEILRVLCIILIFKAFNSVQNAYISKNMLFKVSFICNFVSIIVSGIVGILMAYLDYGIWSLVFQQIIFQVVICLTMFFCVHWRPSLDFSLNSLNTLLGFGWKVFATNLMIVSFENVRGLLVGKIYGPLDLAYFERGKNFPNLLFSNVGSTIQAILFPVFSHKQDDHCAVKSMLRRSIKTSTLIIAPTMIALAVMAKPIVELLLTNKWISAVPYIQIFCLAYLLMPIQTSNMQVITALGRSDVLLKMEVWKKVLEFSILIGSCLISVVAIAWGTVLYNVICLFINLYPNRRLINYGYLEQFKDIAPMLLISVFMGGIMWSCSLFVSSSLLLICIESTIGIVGFCLLCVFFKVEAFSFVLEMLLNAKNKYINTCKRP